MRIAYCTNVRLPSERAHGHQVARVCDALAKLGNDVTIFAPFRKNTVKQDYWQFHKADRKVKLEHLGTFDPIDHWWIPKILQLPLLNLLFKGALVQKLQPFDLLYTRTPALLPALLNAQKKIILELHTLPNHNRGAFVSFCNRCTLIVCLTTPMKNELESWGVTASIIIEPDAADIYMFIGMSQGFVKLPDQKLLSDFSEYAKQYIKEGHPVIGYAGQLESMNLSKGIPELIQATRFLSVQRPINLFIAGPRPGRELMRKILPIEAYGHYFEYLAHSIIPTFLSLCDVLVYPAPKSDHPFYNRDTSPLKLFEYMAAGKPIVTADLPPIRDVLDESTAFFCNPGDPADLARAIADVLDHPEEAHKRAEAARKKVEHYTWDKRMARILEQVA